MKASLDQQLASLPKLSTADLRQLWPQYFKSEPSPGMRRFSLIRFLAYRMQEQAYGAISDRSQRRLHQLAVSSSGAPAKKPIPIRTSPGTRLVRQWQGQTHLVRVEREGYEYRGSRYKSLSEIARLITGTQWSGPLFFGIKSRSKTTPKENQ